MTVTLDNFEDYLLEIPVSTTQRINFFAFNDRPLEETSMRLDEMRPYFARIHPNQIIGIAPIFLLKERPLGGHGGGTYPDISNLRARNPANDPARGEAWGAPIEVLERVVESYGRTGSGSRSLHVIPLADWVQAGRAATVMHECAHGIDNRCFLHRRYASGDPLRPGANFAVGDFPDSLPGQACGHGSPLNRRVVNAFVSMTMGFRGVATPTKRNIVARFRDSHAFNGVPESWWNEQFPGLI
jgi:hypothetical protein